jgi:hypothetical protein
LGTTAPQKGATSKPDYSCVFVVLTLSLESSGCSDGVSSRLSSIAPAGIAIAIPRTRANGAPRLNAIKRNP